MSEAIFNSEKASEHHDIAPTPLAFDTPSDSSTSESSTNGSTEIANGKDDSNDTGQTESPGRERGEVSFFECEDTAGNMSEDMTENMGGDAQNAHRIAERSAVLFVGSSVEQARDRALNLMQNTKPISQFPLSPEEIWLKSNMVKKGTACTVAWTWDRQVTLNVSLGKVTKTYKRGGKGKLNITYNGLHGHKTGEEFSGSLPPQENVRVYQVLWHCAPPPIDYASPENATQECISMGEATRAPEEDVDHLPIPTARNFSPDFIPCVLATYRDIISTYGKSDYPVRNKIWNQMMSAMKLSLATVRLANGRRRRRTPINSQKAEGEDRTDADLDSSTGDRRAIKKAIRLVLEGCTSKATKVLDQPFRRLELSDEQVLEKLQALHPKNEYKIHLPEAAPIIAGISVEELRAAGRRLSKGVSPGPTGTTDSVL